jgi:CheY-like chemotaxis protein
MMNELKRILLAEDNPNDVELTLAALAEHNLANEVVVVSDGAEALDYLYCRGKFKMRSDNQPAVVLLDLKMPKMDGLEVLRMIKKDDRLKTLPVVMLTSSREEKDLVESYSLGVNAYVVKPVDFQNFIDAVKKLGMFWAITNEPPPGTVNAMRWASGSQTEAS